MTRRPLVLGLSLLALAAMAYLMTRPPEAAALTVQAAPLTQTLQFSGRVATPSRVDLGSTLTGRVAEVQVHEGDVVAAGQTLLRLEDAEWQAALAQARAAEQQAAARLAGLRSTGRGGVQAGVAQADADLRAAQAELQRTRALVAQGFLSPARLDEAQRASAVAEARRANALAQRDALADQGSDLQQAQAGLAAAQAATVAAQARLAQASVRAPADAHVLSRQAEPGQIVQAGKPLLTLALAGPLELVATVDERYLPQLQAGQPAQVLADAFPKQPFAARLRSIAPLVDVQRGAVELKFSVAAPPPFLREDMSLSLAVTTAQREQAISVPLAALRADGGLWLVVDGRVQARAVRLGLRSLQVAEVVQGLAAGEQVLVGPAPAPGGRVRTRPWQPDADRPAGTADDAGSAMSQAMGR